MALAAQIDIDKAADGYQVTKIREVSKLKYARNLDRSIAGLMAKEADLPRPFEVSIPMKGQVDQVPSAAILLPHEMFAAFYEKTASWTSSVLPDSSSIQKFWSAFQHHPMMAGHPIKEKPNWHSTTVPIGLHGDEVPVMGVGKIWCRSVLAFSWFSLLASAAGQGFERTNILIWGVFEKFCLPDGHDGENSFGTMQIFWKLMQWSFDIMMSGKWPHHDWRGVPYPRQSPEGQRAGSWLAGGYRGALVQVAGDCDFFSKWLQTPQVTNHQKPCVLCKCSYRGPCSWLDNRPNSLWQRSMVSPSNYRRHWSPQIALYKLPGFSSLALAMDWMHCMYLGWLQHVYGSILHLLVFFILPNSPLDNLLAIGDFIKQFQRSNNVKNRYRMRLDKLTMVQPKKGYPKLRGRAADISGLYSTMVERWNTHMDTADERHRQIRLFLKLNSKLVDILDSFSPRYGYMAIPASQHEELLNAGLNMAQIHSQLHAYYESQDVKIFNQTSKAHFSLHSLQLSCYVHPYLVYCFKGESTMHRVQTLWKSCLHGSKHWQAAKKAAYKERHLLWRQNRI